MDPKKKKEETEGELRDARPFFALNQNEERERLFGEQAEDPKLLNKKY